MDKKGFVYIMNNDSMPGLVKVGRSKKVPTERAKELEDTGVPKPYIVQYYAFFDDMIEAEKRAHKALVEYHYAKEHFETDVGTAIYNIENTGISFKKLYSKPEDDRKAKELERQIQEGEREEIRLAEIAEREEYEEREREKIRLAEIAERKKRELRAKAGTVIVHCTACKQKLRVPSAQKLGVSVEKSLLVTCTKCNNSFDYSLQDHTGYKFKWRWWYYIVIVIIIKILDSVSK